MRFIPGTLSLALICVAILVIKRLNEPVNDFSNYDAPENGPYHQLKNGN